MALIVTLRGVNCLDIIPLFFYSLDGDFCQSLPFLLLLKNGWYWKKLITVKCISNLSFELFTYLFHIVTFQSDVCPIPFSHGIRWQWIKIWVDIKNLLYISILLPFPFEYPNPWLNNIHYIQAYLILIYYESNFDLIKDLFLVTCILMSRYFPVYHLSLRTQMGGGEIKFHFVVNQTLRIT